MIESLGPRHLSPSQRSPVQSKTLLLISVIRESRYTVVEMLIKVGADVNYGHLGGPLHCAALKKDPAYTRLLLQNGADPEKVEQNGRTTLHQAIVTGFVDTIKTIIDGGGNVNKKVERSGKDAEGSPMREAKIGNYAYRCDEGCSTPLMLACGFALEHRSNCSLTFEIVNLLLANGADPRIQDKFGMTVSHYAAIRPFLPLIRLLIDAGAKIDELDKQGRAPLHFLARYPGFGCRVDELRRIAQLLLRDPNSYVGMHLLNLKACMPTADSRDADLSSDSSQSPTSTPNIAGKVLESNKSPRRISYASEHLETPVSIALKNRCWNVFEVFWELGATIPEEIALDSILERAVKGIQPNVVRFLIANGAQITEWIIMMLVEMFPFQISAHKGESNDRNDSNVSSADKCEDLFDKESIADYKEELVFTKGEAPAQDICV